MKGEKLMAKDRPEKPGQANQSTVVEALNWLAVVCKESAYVFQEAYEASSNELLRALLKSYAQQRTHFAIALRAEIYRQGGDAKQSSSLHEKQHDGWLNINSALNEGVEQAIVEACLHQEEIVLQTYDKVCQMNLPADVLALVERQHKELRLTYNNIRRIEEHIDIIF